MYFLTSLQQGLLANWLILYEILDKGMGIFRQQNGWMSFCILVVYFHPKNTLVCWM